MKFNGFLKQILKSKKRLEFHQKNFAEKFSKTDFDVKYISQLEKFLEDQGLYERGRKAAVELFELYRKKHKVPIEKTDGLNEYDIKNIKKALRQVWSWSHSRRLVVKRCELPNGYFKCEECKKRCPKIAVDHVNPVGTFDKGYISRLFVSSIQMRGLCDKCHKVKTKADLKSIKDAKDDFY